MNAATAHPVRAAAGDLIADLAGDRSEAALAIAFDQLGRGADLPLVFSMVRALVKAGLAGMGFRLLRSVAAIEGDQQIEALSRQLAALPSGEIPGELMDRRLPLIRDFVLQANPWLNDVSQDLTRPVAGSGYCVYRSHRGNMHAFRDAEGRLLDTVFPIIDQVGQADLASLPTSSNDWSLLLLGVPSVPLWNRLVGLRSPLGYVPPIDLVEPDPVVLGLWLRMVEDVAPFKGERVALFSGPGHLEHYQRFLMNHRWRQAPTHRLTNPRPRWCPPTIDDAFHAPVLQVAGERREQRRAAIESLYVRRDARWWRRRFQEAGRSGPPLRIVGFTTRYSAVMRHAMRDLASAFVRAGCEFHQVMQANEHCAAVDVQDAILRLQPDLVFVINHLRGKFRESMPANVPYVCWIQDHMADLSTAEAGRSVGELDLVIAHCPDVLAARHGYPLERCLASTNLTDPMTYAAKPASEADLGPHRCDVSFVSHGSAGPDRLVDEIASSAPDSFGELMRRALHLMRLEMRGGRPLRQFDLMGIMLEAERESGHPPLGPAERRSSVFPAVQQVYDRLFRHQGLEWARNWAVSRGRRLHIYGRGWHEHPEFSAFARGEVENGHALRRVFQASAVALQINGHASLDQRLLDGLASGALVVSRYNPADFVRGPLAQVRDFIIREDVRDLGELMTRAAGDPRLSAAIALAEELTGTRIALSSDATRAAHVRRHQQCATLPSEEFSDSGLFHMLRTLKAVPPRQASDLPGFSQTVFRTEDELHTLLDRFVDAPDIRRAVAEPMRLDVLQNDTFDVLALRVLGHFGAREDGS